MDDLLVNVYVRNALVKTDSEILMIFSTEFNYKIGILKVELISVLAP